MKALILASLIALSSPAMASGTITLWGEGATPANETTKPQAEAQKPQEQPQAPAEKPAGALDHVDSAIDTVNRIDRQGAELKRLFGK